MPIFYKNANESLTMNEVCKTTIWKRPFWNILVDIIFEEYQFKMSNENINIDLFFIAWTEINNLLYYTAI